mgnify:CR=1 FL=1
MATTTIFRNFNQPVENKSLILIMKEEILSDKHRPQIERIRQLKAENKPEQADQHKKSLPAFTPSGTFEGGRKMEFLTMYSGFVVLDFDKLAPDTLKAAFNIIKDIPFTFACFRSPSGNGLKVMVEVDTGVELHETAFSQVADYYEKLLAPALGEAAGGLDRSGKDVTRLCFLSWDPEAYYIIQNKKFEVQLEVAPQSEPVRRQGHPQQEEVAAIPEASDNSFWEQHYDFCKKITDKKSTYAQENRNNYIYLLANNCNRRGIPEAITVDLIQNDSFDLPFREIQSTVRSAFKNNGNEFGKFVPATRMQYTEDQDAMEELLLTSPHLPDDIFETLPKLLKQGCEAFTDQRQRDVFLTGAIAILSGCLPNVTGTYDQHRVSPNLSAFVIAPAASGKGVLSHARKLGAEVHRFLLERSEAAKRDYELEMNSYKQRQRFKKQHDNTEEPPEKPPFVILFIPANSSSAMVISHLKESGGNGIMCETEADTMGNTLKQDWGGYSDLLRKAFHHETVSYSRKTNHEFVEIPAPKLSVLLSGTPGQVAGLISSPEDGLFSRFIFYTYKVQARWRDVSPFGNKINLTQRFEELSAEVLELYFFLEASPTIVELSHDQWQILNTTFESWLQEISCFVGNDAESVVIRLGLILYRIAMILTTLRKYEAQDKRTNAVCSDTDFNTALELVRVYKQHAVLMFHSLPKQAESIQVRNPEPVKQFFSNLPDSFKRADAVVVGAQLAIKERTVDKYLGKLCDAGFLEKTNFGEYQKAGLFQLIGQQGPGLAEGEG